MPNTVTRSCLLMALLCVAAPARAGGPASTVTGGGPSGAGVAPSGVSGLAPAPNHYRYRLVRFARPALADEAARQRAAGAPMSPAAQVAWGEAIAAEQAAAETILLSEGVPILWRYRRAVNGLQVRLSPHHTLALRSLPGVVAVHPVALIRPELESSTAHMGVSQAADTLGVDGEGVDIGILDSGVDYLHVALGGPGSPAAYDANDHATVDDTWAGQLLFPNAKVVGGWDFVGSAYDAEDASLPVPDADPMPDADGDDPDEMEDHGTHVAATAAGLPQGDFPPGVAPGARIWALKCIGVGKTSMTSAAIDWALDPNQDGVLDDALDILNLSIGSAYSGGGGAHTTASALAIDAFVSHGGVVVASAGNRGDVPFVVSGPGSVVSAISVANAYDAGETGTLLTWQVPGEAQASMIAKSASGSFAPSLSDVGPVEGLARLAGKACDPASIPSDLAGHIALVERRDCTYGTKFANVAAKGAIAVVMLQDVPQPLVTMSSTPPSSIPGIMIGQADADWLRSVLSDGVSVTLTMAAGVPTPWLADTVRASSSRGPGFPDRDTGTHGVGLKPDLSAPGVRIMAAQAGTGAERVSKTGTSMAAPHVAGAAALLRAHRPDLTPLEIKALLMSTGMSVGIDPDPTRAGPAPRAPLSRVGAGRVHVPSAVATETIAYGLPSVTLDFGLQVVRAPMSVSRVLRVAHRGDEEVRFNATVQLRSDAAASGAQITVSESELVVPPAGEVEVGVTLDLTPETLPAWALENRPGTATRTGDGEALSAMEIDGHVVLTPSGTGSEERVTLRVPLYALVRRSASVQTEGACLRPAPAELRLVNGADPEGWSEIFTLVAEDPVEEASWAGADLRAVGLRTRDDIAGHGGGMEIALWTWGERLVPGQVVFAVYLDVTGDGVAEFLLTTVDAQWEDDDDPSGHQVALLLKAAEFNTSAPKTVTYLSQSWDVVEQLPIASDAFSSSAVLPVRWEAMGLEGSPDTLGMWTLTFDGSAGYSTPFDAIDRVPDEVRVDHIIWQKEPVVVTPSCGLWGLDVDGVTIDESRLVDVTISPTCPTDEAGVTAPRDLMVLHGNGPAGGGVEPVELVRVPAAPVDATCGRVVLEAAGETCGSTLTEGGMQVGLAALSACLGPLDPTSSPSQPLGLGDHIVDLAFEDGWSRQGVCQLPVTVEDTTAPLLSCPVTQEVAPGSTWTVPFEAQDPCGLSVQVEDLDCEGSPCALHVGEGALVLTAAATGLSSVTWRMMASDDLGHETRVECALKVVRAPAPRSGCALSGRWTGASWIVAALLLLARCRRRETA